MLLRWVASAGAGVLSSLILLCFPGATDFAFTVLLRTVTSHLLM